jgi:hypothetical protein
MNSPKPAWLDATQERPVRDLWLADRFSIFCIDADGLPNSHDTKICEFLKNQPALPEIVPSSSNRVKNVETKEASANSSEIFKKRRVKVFFWDAHNWNLETEACLSLKKLLHLITPDKRVVHDSHCARRISLPMFALSDHDFQEKRVALTDDREYSVNFMGHRELTFPKSPTSRNYAREIQTCILDQSARLLESSTEKELRNQWLALLRRKITQEKQSRQRSLADAFLDKTLSSDRRWPACENDSDLPIYSTLLTEMEDSFQKAVSHESIASDSILSDECHRRLRETNTLRTRQHSEDYIFPLWLSFVRSMNETPEELPENTLLRFREIFRSSYRLVKQVANVSAAFDPKGSTRLADLALHLCRASGCDVRFKNSAALPACAMRIEGKRIIFIHKKLTDRHQFRLMMHELGHLTLKHRASSEFGMDLSRLNPEVQELFNTQEKEADLFASSCLFSTIFIWILKHEPQSPNPSLLAEENIEHSKLLDEGVKHLNTQLFRREFHRERQQAFQFPLQTTP